MSAEFMQELVQYLKDGKKLHRKYAFKVRGRGMCGCVRGGVSGEGHV